MLEEKQPQQPPRKRDKKQTADAFNRWAADPTAKNGEANSSVQSIRERYAQDADLQVKWRDAIRETVEVIYKRDANVVNIKFITQALVSISGHVFSNIPPVRVIKRQNTREAEIDAEIKQAALNHAREQMDATITEQEWLYEAMVSGFGTIEHIVTPRLVDGEEEYVLGMRLYKYNQVVWDSRSTMPNFGDARRVSLHYKLTRDMAHRFYPQAKDTIDACFYNDSPAPANIDGSRGYTPLLMNSANTDSSSYVTMCRHYWMEERENENGFAYDMVFFQDFIFDHRFMGGGYGNALKPVTSAQKQLSGGGRLPVVGVCFGARDPLNNRPIGPAESLRDVNIAFNRKVADLIDHSGGTSITATTSAASAMGNGDIAKGVQRLAKQGAQAVQVYLVPDQENGGKVTDKLVVDKHTTDMDKAAKALEFLEHVMTNITGISSQAMRGVQSNETSGVAIANRAKQNQSSLTQLMSHFFAARALGTKIQLADLEKFMTPRQIYTYIDAFGMVRSLSAEEKAKAIAKIKDGRYSFSDISADVVIDHPYHAQAEQRRSLSEKLFFINQTIKDPNLALIAIMLDPDQYSAEAAKVYAMSLAKEGIQVVPDILDEKDKEEIAKILQEKQAQQAQQIKLEQGKVASEIRKNDSLALSNNARAAAENNAWGDANSQAEAALLGETQMQ